MSSLNCRKCWVFKQNKHIGAWYVDSIANPLILPSLNTGFLSIIDWTIVFYSFKQSKKNDILSVF